MAEAAETKGADSNREWITLGELLTRIKIAPEQTVGYDRDDWKHWSDEDSDGMDTRQEVLADESLGETVIVGGRVQEGVWTSLYDGQQTDNPRSLDVDHVVALAEAHQSGGWAWDSLTRQLYANDLTSPDHLIAVSASSNRSKGADDPSEWLPPNDEALCTYLAWWTTIKFRWDLNMDQLEHDAIAQRAETTCADTQINLEAVIRVGVIQVAANAPPTPPPAPTAASSANQDCHRAYSPCLPVVADLNCSDVYELDLSRITVLDPDDDPYRLDGNNDGVACTSP